MTGTNTTENHPVIGTFMKRAVKNGAKMIVADPRAIELSKWADIYLPIQPGTNVAMLNGMMHHIIEHNLYDADYVNTRTEGFEELKASLVDFTLQKAAAICGVSEEALGKAAEIYATSEVSAIYYAMGITQHSSGTDHVKAIANLAMLCGFVGKENGGVNPLRGQNNVQGACDMGGLPNVYPGYQKVTDPKVSAKFKALWDVKDLSEKKGLTIPKMMDRAYDGQLKCLYIMGENPMISDPDLNHIEKALHNLDFLVVQDIFMTETSALADVVLPVACFAEKEGTFTNTERRIQRVRKVVDAPGLAQSDSWVFIELMERMGYKQVARTPDAIMEEIASVTPQYAGIHYNRLDAGGLQWPCVSDADDGTPYLHKHNFAKGIGTFHVTKYQPSAEIADAEYPLILTTGRVLYQYHTRTMTGRSKGLNTLAGEAFVEITQRLANTLNVEDGEMVKVTSKRGTIEVKVRVTENKRDKVVFIPFHYAEAAANKLTHAALDPETDIPEYKVCAVKIEKLKVGD